MLNYRYMSKKVRRLYRQFQPVHYDLALAIDPEAMTSSGSVTITGKKVDRPSERLTFHQNELTVTSASITRHDKRGDKDIAIKRINHHGSFNEVRLHTGELIYPGQYTIKLTFKNPITRPMNGIYPCFFKDNGRQKKMIATQFESHHARETFPCIDEPEAKATFDLSLTTPKGETVIANTPIKNEMESGTVTTTTFETTPKMSTYLLAFVLGDLKYKEAKTKDGVVVRTYATPDNVGFTDFALETAVNCLEFYNDYFDTPYPLAKCDLIALPDFASGAMENWGCITFREQCMLVDPKNTSLPNKQYVAMVVAHELAHQWFGNLVTMRWWTDLWLNEGFASWIEYLATDHNFPEWKMWTQFIVDEQQQALKLDALKNTHPIEVPINHPDEIRTIFDAISYSKGSSVIHMLEQYLGADVFRDGLRLYLKTHAYSNTDTVDLWAALQEVSGKPVKDFMHGWTTQLGFPILRTTIDGEMLTTQERFLLNPKAENQPQDAWPVPLLSSSELPKALMSETTYKAPLPKSDKPFLLNKDRSGFYRVVYNPTHLFKLGEAIKAGRLEPLDRAGLLSDTFEAAKAGHFGTVEALKFLESYQNEDSVVVWEIIGGALSSIRLVMDDEALRDDMKPFTRKLVATQLKRLDWQPGKDELHFDSLLRPLILGMASYGEEAAVVKEARRLFDTMKTPEDLAPDLRGVIYGTIARTGDAKDFDKILKTYSTTNSSEERVTLAAVLTGFEQSALIEKALGLIDSDTVRLQDVGYWVAYSFMNRHAKKQTWQWMTSHWQWLTDNLSSDLSFSRMPIYSGRAFSDEKFIKTFSSFFASVMMPGFERSVQQGIETIEWQSAWRSRDLKLVKTFFKS